MSIHLISALGLLVVVNGIIALVQEGKDKTISAMAIVTLILGAVFTMWPYVHLLNAQLLVKGQLWFKIAGLALAIFGVLDVVRLQNRVVGAFICAGAVLIGLITVRAIDY